MPTVYTVRHFKTILLLLITVAVVTNCSKKETKPTAAAPTVEMDSNASAAAANTPAAPQAVIPASTDINQSFADADAALKVKAYDKAVQNLLAVQNQRQLTEQQAQEARNRMVGLQRNLAAAIAEGDPNAKAAAEMLRRSATVR
jgi:hypothetical protein